MTWTSIFIAGLITYFTRMSMVTLIDKDIFNENFNTVGRNRCESQYMADPVYFEDYDINGDGFDDYPDFDVENFRYDIRADWEINPDLTVSVSQGYAKARNINITGIARYIADGWVYRYIHGRIMYKSWYLQSYLNTSYSGDYNSKYPLAFSPTRNLATGGTIYDRSKQLSTQLQQANEFFNGKLRFVWGID